MAFESIGLGGQLDFTAGAAVSSMRSAGRAFGALESATDEAGASLVRYDERAARASRSSDRLAMNVGKVSNGMASVGRAMQGAAVVTGVLAAGFGFALKEAAAFGTAIGEVRTITDEQTFSTQKLEEVTLGMAAKFGGTGAQQAQALYQTISAGVSEAAAATELMDTANQLAVGGVTDMTTSVDLLTTAVNVYGTDIDGAGGASDVFFQTVKSGKTTVRELARSFGQVAKIAKDSGVTFEELNGALATMTLGGIRTSVAAAGMRAAISNIIKPTKDAEKEAEKLGIRFDAASLRSKGLVGFLQSITSSSKFTEDSMSKLFGSVEGLTAALALSAGGAAKLSEIVDTMGDAGGATGEAFRKMTETTTFQFGLLRARVSNIMVRLGKALEPLAVDVMKPLISLVGDLGNMFEETDEAGFGSGIADGLAFVKRQIQGVVSLFQRVRTAIDETFTPEQKATFAKIGTILAVVAAASAPLIVGMLGFGFILSSVIIPAVTGLFSILSGLVGILLGPVGLAIAAVVVGFVFFRDEIWSVIQGIRAGLVPMFDAIREQWSQIGTVFVDVWNQITGMFSDGTNSMKVDWKDVGAFIGTMIGAAVQVIGFLVQVVVFAGKAIFDTFAEVFQTVGKLIGGLAAGFHQIFSGDIVAGLKTLGQAILDFMLAPLKSTIRTVVALATAIPGAAKLIPESVKKFAEAGAAGVRLTPGAPAKTPDSTRRKATEALAAQAKTGAGALKLPDIENIINLPKQDPPKLPDINLDGKCVVKGISSVKKENDERGGIKFTNWQKQTRQQLGTVPGGG